MREISNNTNADFHVNINIKRNMTEQLQRHANQDINRDPLELDAKSIKKNDRFTNLGKSFTEARKRLFILPGLAMAQY